MKTRKQFIKLSLLVILIFSIKSMGQSPTQQWLTVLNSTSTSVDQIYGFSTPTGGCADNGNYFFNVPILTPTKYVSK